MGGWNFAPVGWAFCDGSILSISQFEVLFTLIGTTYGGNGTTNFMLPNLLGRIPIHQGTDSAGNTYVMGQYGGVEEVTLPAVQLPAHSHALQATTGTASSTNPAGAVLAAAAADVYSAPSANGANLVTTSSTTTPAGGGQPHANLMPFQCVTFVIAMEGIYPSQN